VTIGMSGKTEIAMYEAWRDLPVIYSLRNEFNDPTIQELIDYFQSKERVGVLHGVNGFQGHANSYIIWVAGMSPEMWDRVLKPEAKRILQHHPDGVDVIEEGQPEAQFMRLIIRTNPNAEG